MPAASIFYSRVFALVVAAVLLWGLYLVFLPFLAALSWAMFLAFLLFPLNLGLRRRLHGRARAAGLLTVLTPLVILLPLAALSIEFVAQASALLQSIQDKAQHLDIKTFADLRQFPTIAHADAWVQGHFNVSAAQIQGWIVTATRELLQGAAKLGGSFFLGALGSIIGFTLTMFLLFYFLCDGDEMWARAIELIPLDRLRKERLVRQLGEVTRAIVFGTTVNAVAQGLLLGLAFAIAGLPAPVVVGVAVALVCMLPVGGPIFAWIPGAAWLFYEGRWGYAILMIAWGVMLSGLDNVLKPLLISGQAKISSLAVFVGVLGGVSAFGTIGIVLGPVLLSLVIALIEFAEESAAERSAA